FGTFGVLVKLERHYGFRGLHLTHHKRIAILDEREERSGNHTGPRFTPDNVLPTFEFLLASRHRVLAEKVDGLFQNLSRTHVTNQPEGFGKRMILQYVVSESGSYPDPRRVGYIHDLRGVIARFMGRDDPHYNDTRAAVMRAVEVAGQWITLDGGALRLRVYRGVRTGHLEVHPDRSEEHTSEL